MASFITLVLRKFTVFRWRLFKRTNFNGLKDATDFKDANFNNVFLLL